MLEKGRIKGSSEIGQYVYKMQTADRIQNVDLIQTAERVQTGRSKIKTAFFVQYVITCHLIK